MFALLAEIGKKEHFHAILFFFLFTIFPPGQSNGAVLPMSLPEALSHTLGDNLILKQYQLGSSIAEELIRIEKSRYIPTVTASTLLETEKKAPLVSAAYHERFADDYRLALASLNPLGGMTTLNLYSQRETLRPLTPGSSADLYSARTFLRYDQPLLKGFGPAVNNLPIEKAAISGKFANEQFEYEKATLLYQTYREYYILYRIMEELQLRNDMRKETANICAMLSEKVEARKLPVNELKTMESVRYMLDKDVLDLENRKKEQERRLQVAIRNRFNQEEEIVPLTLPQVVIRNSTIPEDIQNTQRNIEKLDLTLLQLQSELKLAEKDRQKAIDDLKQDLRLSLEVGLTGNDANDRFKAISGISTNNYQMMLGLTFTLPVVNTAAESRLAEKSYQQEQIRLRIRNRGDEIKKAVLDLYSNLNTVRRKMELDGKIVEIAKENLDNEVERLMRGKSTSLNTSDYQTRYINAKQGMLDTTIEYVLLIGSYHLQTRKMELVAAAATEGQESR